MESLLVRLGVVALVLAAGFFIGVRWEQGRVAEANIEAINAAAAASRIAAQTESDAALAFAKAQAQKRLAARDQQHQLELEIARDQAARTCRVSDGTFGVLLKSIDAANATTGETK